MRRNTEESDRNCKKIVSTVTANQKCKDTCVDSDSSDDDPEAEGTLKLPTIGIGIQMET